MSLISLLFWGLVVVTVLISLRWGAMIGLIVFVFVLMVGAVAISRWSPPKGDASTVYRFERWAEAESARSFGRDSIISIR